MLHHTSKAKAEGDLCKPQNLSFEVKEAPSAHSSAIGHTVGICCNHSEILVRRFGGCCRTLIGQSRWNEVNDLQAPFACRKGKSNPLSCSVVVASRAELKIFALLCLLLLEVFFAPVLDCEKKERSGHKSMQKITLM